MTERREPTISPLQSNDEPRPNRVSVSPQKTGAKPASGGNGGKRQAPAQKSGSGLAIFAFVVALAACGAAGVLYLQLMKTGQSLDAATKTLASAETRILNLEQKLELTGDESVQSMTALQAQIKTNMSEIRKLWGVSYDTNRGAIAENKSSVDAIRKDIAALKSSSSKVEANLNKALTDLKADVSVLSELMDAQQGVLAKVDSMSQSQKNAVDELVVRIKSLDKKVLSNEEAIKAIDAFRLQVNRELIRLAAPKGS